jgi:TPR repeat protein
VQHLNSFWRSLKSFFAISLLILLGSIYSPLFEFSSPNGQYAIGQMYLTGHALPQSYKQAVLWFRKSAAQQDKDAQWSLGEMYEHGRGVAANPVVAVALYKLAGDPARADLARLSLRLDSAQRLSVNRLNDQLAQSADILATLDSYQKQTD